MKALKTSIDPPKEGGNLRNFGLSVEEIKLMKAIKDMTQSLENIESRNSENLRLNFFRTEIRRLENQLEDIRENTLIR